MRRLRSLLKPLVILSLAAGVPRLAFSLPEDRDKPITLEAERAQLDQKTGTSVYEGHVVITQGSMQLVADTATIYTKDGAFQRMEAVGKPATWHYKPAVDKEEVHGYSQHVDYDAIKKLVVMTTNARITQGQDEFKGDRVEYDMNTDLVKARAKEGGRVQFTIQPKTASQVGPGKKK